MRHRRHHTPGGSLAFAVLRDAALGSAVTAIAGKSAAQLCQANGSPAVRALQLSHCDLQPDLAVAAVA